MSCLRVLLPAVAMLLAATMPSAALAGAGEGVGYRLTGGPGSTLTGGFIRLPAVAGGSAQASFVAANTTKGPVNVRFYGADGNTTRATGAVFGSSKPVGVGTWLTPSRASATLPAGSEMAVSVTVRVPPGTGPGDYVGAVIMEQIDNTSTATVSQVVRYAVPLLVDLAGGSGAQLALGTSRLSHIPGTEIAAVVLPLTNTGTRLCRPVVTARVAGDAGPTMVVQRQLDEILPGDQINYPLRMGGDMAPGTYLVRAEVTGCGSPLSTSTTTKLDGSDVAAPTTPTPGQSGAANAGDGSGAITPVPLKKSKKGAGGAGNGGKSSEQTSSGASSDEGGAGDDRAAAAAGGRPKPPKSSSWLKRASEAVAEAAPKVLERASVPLGASGLVGLLFLFQNALDRRDPKLVRAPRERDSALRFDPNPLHP